MRREAIAEQSALSNEWRSLQPAVTEELLQGIAQRIVERFAPDRVVLFGSHVRGATHPDSDIDLLVIMASDETMARRIVRVTEVAHPGLIPMDVLVYTPQEIDNRVALGDPFLTEILRTGRTLYQRGSD